MPKKQWVTTSATIVTERLPDGTKRKRVTRATRTTHPKYAGAKNCVPQVRACTSWTVER